MLPQVKDYLSEDDNVSAWLTSSKINSFAPFFSSISKDSDDISALAEIKTQQDGVEFHGELMLQMMNGD